MLHQLLLGDIHSKALIASTLSRSHRNRGRQYQRISAIFNINTSARNTLVQSIATRTSSCLSKFKLVSSKLKLSYQNYIRKESQQDNIAYFYRTMTPSHPYTLANSTIYSFCSALVDLQQMPSLLYWKGSCQAPQAQDFKS